MLDINYHNDKKFRRIFFISLVVIFLLVAPILILYSMGYRFDLQNRQIIETGVISIDIKPREAEVYLNNIKITKDLPIRLTNRTPGIYNLKFSLDGYKVWEKNIDVKSRQTTYIKDINLIRESLPVKIENSPSDIDTFLPSTDGRFILTSSVENNIREIFLFDSQTELFTPIFRFDPNTNYNLEWSPFDNYILLTKPKYNSTSVSILSAEDTENIANFDIYTPGLVENTNHQWNTDSPVPTLFVQEGARIVRLTTNDRENIYNNIIVKNWYIDNQDKLWVIKDDFLYINDNKNENTDTTIPNSSEIKEIIDINSDRAILKNDNSVIVISRKGADVESINTKNFQRNPSTNEWLTWSEWELWSIYEHDKPALLNRTSDNIKHVFPLDEFGVLAIINNKGIEAFNPGYYVSQNLYGGEIYNMSVNKREKRIYMYGKIGESTGIYQLDY